MLLLLNALDIEYFLMLLDFKKIADKYSIKFYERDKKFSSDSSTNDDFANDFIKNIKADILIQILPTSPFLTKEEIMSFYKVMIKKKFDTLISVENKQIACIFIDTFRL